MKRNYFVYFISLGKERALISVTFIMNFEVLPLIHEQMVRRMKEKWKLKIMVYKIFNTKTISSFVLVIFNFHFSPHLLFFHSPTSICSIFFNLSLFIFFYFLLPLLVPFVISRSSFPHFLLDNFIIHLLILLPFSTPHLLLLHFLLEKRSFLFD